MLKFASAFIRLKLTNCFINWLPMVICKCLLKWGYLAVTSKYTTPSTKAQSCGYIVIISLDLSLNKKRWGTSKWSMSYVGWTAFWQMKISWTKLEDRIELWILDMHIILTTSLSYRLLYIAFKLWDGWQVWDEK